MRAILGAALVLLGTLDASYAVPNGVKIQDVQGSQSGQYFFKLTTTYHLTTDFTWIRIPTPQVNYITDSNEYDLVLNAPGTGVAVMNMNGTNADWGFSTPFNQGLASAGIWIWVKNPDHTSPYTPYDFQLEIAVKDVNYTYAYPLDRDIQVFSSGTNFTNATQDIDSDFSTIKSGVTQAMAQPGTFHGGNLGRIERYHAWMLSKVDFVNTDATRASDVLFAGKADCDGSVNLLCALMRAGDVSGNNKVACKPMMVGDTGASNSLVTGAPGLHAVGSYWNGGGKWVNYEGQWSENFAGAGAVFLSAVEDLNYAYIQSTGTPPANPTSVSFVGSHAITNHDTYAIGDTRTFGPSSPQALLSTRQSLVSLKAPLNNVAIHDSLGTPLPNVGVPPAAAPNGLKLVPLQNPARGSIRMAMTLPAQGEAEALLYDVTGRRVGVLAPKGIYPAGVSSLQFVGAGLNAGVYFARISSNGKTAATRVILER